MEYGDDDDGDEGDDEELMMEEDEDEDEVDRNVDDDEDEAWDSEGHADGTARIEVTPSRKARYGRLLEFMSPHGAPQPHLARPLPPMTDNTISDLNLELDDATMDEFSSFEVDNWFQVLGELEHTDCQRLAMEQPPGTIFGGLVRFMWQFFHWMSDAGYTGARSHPTEDNWAIWQARLTEARKDALQRPPDAVLTALEGILEFVEMAERARDKWDRNNPRPASSMSLSVSPSVSPSPASPILNPAASSSPSPTTPPTPPPVLILRLSGFVEFYREACLDRVDAVWNDLTCHGFRHDLKREDGYLAAGEDGQLAGEGVERPAPTEEEKEAALPRSIFAQHLNYHQLLFHILTLSEQRLIHPTASQQPKRQDGEGDESELQTLAGSVWSLLQRLSSQPSLVQQLMQLQPPISLDALLSPQSLYCLLYSLQILDALCEPIEDNDDKLTRTQLQQQRDVWCDAFVDAGGFAHLMRLFDHHPALSRDVPSGALLSLRQQCAALLFRLLYHLTLSAMRVQMPQLGCVDRVKGGEGDATMDQSDREEEQRWIAREKEREDNEEKSQPPALFVPFTHSQAHGPLQEHEMDRKETEEKRRDESSKEADSSKQRVSVSVDDDESDSEEDTLLSRSLSSSSQPLLLGCHMSTAQSTAIVSSLQLMPLLYRFFNLVHDVSQHPIVTLDDLAVVEPALNLLLHLILFATSKLLPVYRSLLVTRHDLFFDILLCSSACSPPLRRLFCQCQYQLAIHTTGEIGEGAGTGMKVWLLRYLLDHFPTQPASGDRAVECDEYFKLLSALIVEQIHDENAAAGLDSHNNKDELIIAPPTAPLSPSGSAYSDTSSASSASSSSSSSTSLSSAGQQSVVWQLPVSALFVDLCWRLHTYEPMEYEQPSGFIAQDKVLCGILCLLRLLVEQRHDLKQLASHPLHELKAQQSAQHSASPRPAQPAATVPPSGHHLISQLFWVYLFDVPSKARHPDTRGNALSLLTAVCSLPINSAVLFALLTRQHQSLTHLGIFDFNVEKLVRSSYGHVGLRNLGSTCFDMRTQVVVDAGDGRGPRWMNGDQVWRLWQDKAARARLRIASLHTANEAEAASGEMPGARDKLVYSRLVDVVAPFVYNDHYTADEHPVRIRGAHPQDAGADLVLTPDHMVWAAPCFILPSDCPAVGSYRRVRADEVAQQAARGVSWQLRTSAPLSAGKDFSLSLAPLFNFLNSQFDLPGAQSNLSALLSEKERGVLNGLSFTGAAMDAWLAFAGFHIAARSAPTHDESETRPYAHQPPRSFVHSIAKRLPPCLSGAVLDSLSSSTLAALPLIISLSSAGLFGPASSSLPGWLWRLSPRQLRILFVGMAHSHEPDASSEAKECEWCHSTHAMQPTLSTGSRHRADELQLLAMHAGLVCHVAFSPAGGYAVTFHDNPPICTVSSSCATVKTGAALFDRRASVRSRRFWCVTTAADSHVVLVRRCVSGPKGHRSYRTALVGQCYMNSLLQQLYMMPSFRYGVWLSSLDCPLAREQREAQKAKQLQAGERPDAALLEKEKKALECGEDDLLYQLQVMFAYLSQSNKQYYDTLPFCFSYKDERGQPINVRIQQDAQEFFNVLLDRLEKRLMSLPYPPSLSPLSHLIQSSFGGTLVNQLLCHACHNIRSSPEPFYSLSLQVKNKSTLSDSLDAYVLGEELSDFNCSECKQRVNITKRVCLGSLPPVVIMHLKRFELNYETFQHEKLNNRFVFPLDVNLEPYTNEGLARLAKQAANDDTSPQPAADSAQTGTDGIEPLSKAEGSGEAAEDVKPPGYYDYELVGILIHTGNSTSGHYYSFVKDRCLPLHNPNTSSSPPAPVWLEFNDNQIRPFDLTSLDEAAYGGEQEVTERSTWGNDIVTQQDKVKNAYMLIYERKQPASSQQNRTQPATNGNAHSTQSEQSSAEKGSSQPDWLSPELLAQPMSRIIPPSMMAAVERDNRQFQFDRQVFSADYFNFLIHFMRSARPPLPSTTPLTLADLALLQSGGAEAVSDTVPVEVLYSLRLCHLTSVFAFDCLVRCADNKCFVEYARELQSLLQNSVAGCQWLLDWLASRATALSDLLLACRDDYVRDGVKNIIVTALRKVSALETSPTLLDTIESEVDSKTATPATAAGTPVGSAPSSPNARKIRARQFTSVSSRYIAAHLSQLSEAAKHWMRFTQYFELLYQFALMGTPQCCFLVANGCIARLCDMYLGEASPLNFNKRKRASIGNVMVAPNWPAVLELVAHLVRSCRTDQSPRCVPPHASIVVMPLAPAVVAATTPVRRSRSCHRL